MNVVQEFPVEGRHQLPFLWMRDLISQDCNRSETQIFTQWTKIGFCWYTDQIRPKIASDPRSWADFVQTWFVPRSPRFLSWSHYSPRNSWFLIILCLGPWPQNSVSQSDLGFATGHGWVTHPGLIGNIYLFIIQISPSQAICPLQWISIRDQRQSQQSPSGWPMTLMSIAITISDQYSPPQSWHRRIFMSPCWCLRSGPPLCILQSAQVTIIRRGMLPKWALNTSQHCLQVWCVCCLETLCWIFWTNFVICHLMKCGDNWRWLTLSHILLLDVKLSPRYFDEGGSWGLPVAVTHNLVTLSPIGHRNLLSAPN